MAACDEDKILFFNSLDILLVEVKNRKVYLNIDETECLSHYSVEVTVKTAQTRMNTGFLTCHFAL